MDKRLSGRAGESGVKSRFAEAEAGREVASQRANATDLDGVLVQLGQFLYACVKRGSLG